jgi:hypothetical protein
MCSEYDMCGASPAGVYFGLERKERGHGKDCYGHRFALLPDSRARIADNICRCMFGKRNT